MNQTELTELLDFLRSAEQLKDTMRSGYTSEGRRESVAEHTWRLCLMVLVFEEHFPEVDIARLIKICIVHDLGEAINGDVPAPQQDTSSGPGKAETEREDLLRLVDPLPSPLRDKFVDLWDEYEQGSTPEARVAKGLDKLETILQHNQGQNPEDFDYRYNLDYGKEYTSAQPVLSAIRKILDQETRQKAEE